MHVERREGDADEQRRRRGRITVVEENEKQKEDEQGKEEAEAKQDADASETQEKVPGIATNADQDPASVPSVDSSTLGAPLQTGALPTVPSLTRPSARSLFRPPSPLLRPLSSLSWPPEPDSLIFLDPLRRDDPKPLMRSQLRSLTLDSDLRVLLAPPTIAKPEGEPHRGLSRALQSLDALPTDAHRTAALELILGISSQSPSHPHASSHNPTHSNSNRNVYSGPGHRRPISEAELLRLGVKVGPDEVVLVRRLAELVSKAVDGPEYDAGGWEREKEEEREKERRELERLLRL